MLLSQIKSVVILNCFVKTSHTLYFYSFSIFLKGQAPIVTLRGTKKSLSPGSQKPKVENAGQVLDNFFFKEEQKFKTGFYVNEACKCTTCREPVLASFNKLKICLENSFCNCECHICRDSTAFSTDTDALDTSLEETGAKPKNRRR